jgi:predicted nucleic acid-binding protein
MAYLLDTHVLSETVSPPRPKLVLWVSGCAFDLGSSSLGNRAAVA